MGNCWIVIADSAQGRIFSADTDTGKIGEIEGLVHAASRLRDRELVSDRAGRAFDSVGGGRHAMSDHTTAHRKESDLFARHLAARLRTGYEKGEFKRLRLAAPPMFLGLLRKHLDSNVLNSVEKTLAKDLVHESPKSIAAYFLNPEKE